MWLSLISLVIGGALGGDWREIYQLKKIKPKEEAKPGVALGSYANISETKQVPTVVRSKTPQQMEWLARERLNREVLSGIHKER